MFKITVWRDSWCQCFLLRFILFVLYLTPFCTQNKYISTIKIAFFFKSFSPPLLHLAHILCINKCISISFFFILSFLFYSILSFLSIFIVYCYINVLWLPWRTHFPVCGSNKGMPILFLITRSLKEHKFNHTHLWNNLLKIQIVTFFIFNMSGNNYNLCACIIQNVFNNVKTKINPVLPGFIWSSVAVTSMICQKVSQQS